MLKITYSCYASDVTVYFDDDVFLSLPEKNFSSEEEKIKFLKELCANADTSFARMGYPNHFHVYRIRQKETDSHLPKEKRPYYLVIQDFLTINNDLKIEPPVDPDFQKKLIEKMADTKVNSLSADSQEVLATTNKIIEASYKGQYFKRVFELFDQNGKKAYFEQVAQSSAKKSEPTSPVKERETKSSELTTTLFPSPKEPSISDLEQEYDVTKIEERIDQTFSIHKSNDVQVIQESVRHQSEILGESLNSIMAAKREIEIYKEKLKSAPEFFDHEQLSKFAEKTLTTPIGLLEDAFEDFRGQTVNLGKMAGTFSTLVKAYSKNYEVNKNKLRLFNRTFAYFLYTAAVDYYRELVKEAKGDSDKLKKSIAVFNHKFGCIKITVCPDLGRLSDIEHLYNYFDNLTLEQIAKIMNSDKEPKGLLQLCNTTTFNISSMTSMSTSLGKIHEHLKQFDAKCSENFPDWKGPFFTLKGKTDFTWTEKALRFEQSQNTNCEHTMDMLKGGTLFKETTKTIKQNDDLENAKAKIDKAQEALKTATDTIKNKKGILILQAEGDRLLKQASLHQQEIQKLESHVFNLASNIMDSETAEGSEQQHILKDLGKLVRKANEPVAQTRKDVSFISSKLVYLNRPSSKSLNSLNDAYKLMIDPLQQIIKNKELMSLYHRSAVMMHATFFIDESLAVIADIAKKADAQFKTVNLENHNSYTADQAKETHQRIKKIHEDMDSLKREMILNEKELAELLEQNHPDSEKLKALVDALEAKYQRSNALKKMAKENLTLLDDLLDLVTYDQQYQEVKKTFAELDKKVKEKAAYSNFLKEQLSLADSYFKEVKEQCELFFASLPPVIDFVKDEKSFYPDLDEEHSFAELEYNNHSATLGTCDLQLSNSLENLKKIQENIEIEVQRIEQLEEEEAKAIKAMTSPPSFLSRSLPKNGINFLYNSPASTPASASAPTKLRYSDNGGKKPQTTIPTEYVPPPAHVENSLAVQICKKLKDILQNEESLKFWENLTNYKTICFIKCGGKTVTTANKTTYRVQTGVSDMFTSMTHLSGYTNNEENAKQLLLAVINKAKDARERSKSPGLKYGLFKAREDAVDHFYRCFIGNWNLNSLNDKTTLKGLLDSLNDWDNKFGPASTKRLSENNQSPQQRARSAS